MTWWSSDLLRCSCWVDDRKTILSLGRCWAPVKWQPEDNTEAINQVLWFPQEDMSKWPLWLSSQRAAALHVYPLLSVKNWDSVSDSIIKVYHTNKMNWKDNEQIISIFWQQTFLECASEVSEWIHSKAIWLKPFVQIQHNIHKVFCLVYLKTQPFWPSVCLEGHFSDAFLYQQADY